MALVISTIDSNSSTGKLAGDSSRNSASSSSRKLEFVSLVVPTIGVIALNQLVLVTPITDFLGENSRDLVGLQWY